MNYPFPLLAAFDTSFWVGLAVGIPLSILANFLTPAVQRKLDERRQSVSLKRVQEILAEYQRIKEFYVNRPMLAEYLIMVILRATLVGSLAGVISGLFFMTGSIFSVGGAGRQTEIFYLLGQIAAIGGAFVTIRLCMPALRDFGRVRNFAEYETVMFELLDRHQHPRPES